MFLKNVICYFAVFLYISVSAMGYINISPTTLDKNIGAGAYEEFTLSNNTSIPMRYKVEAVAMDSKNGKIKNMNDWAEIYPKIINVRPAESKKFKVYIKAPKGTGNGDYGMFLNIRQVSAPKLEGETEESIVGAGMMVMTNLNLGLYGYVGDKNPKLDTTAPVLEKREDGTYLKMDIENKSNRLVRIKVEAKTGKNRFYPIGEMRVLTNRIVMVDNKIQRLPENEIIREIVISNTENKEIIKRIKI